MLEKQYMGYNVVYLSRVRENEIQCNCDHS